MRRDCTKCSKKSSLWFSYYNVLMLKYKISFKITWVKNDKPSLNRSNVLMRLHSWQFRFVFFVNLSPPPPKKMEIIPIILNCHTVGYLHLAISFLCFKLWSTMIIYAVNYEKRIYISPLRICKAFQNCLVSFN